jgi:hypothetical protein
MYPGQPNTVQSAAVEHKCPEACFWTTSRSARSLEDASSLSASSTRSHYFLSGIGATSTEMSDVELHSQTTTVAQTLGVF